MKVTLTQQLINLEAAEEEAMVVSDLKAVSNTIRRVRHNHSCQHGTEHVVVDLLNKSLHDLDVIGRLDGCDDASVGEHDMIMAELKEIVQDDCPEVPDSPLPNEATARTKHPKKKKKKEKVVSSQK